MAANPRSLLDPGQIIKDAYDEANQRIRTDAVVTATIVGPQEVIISQVDDSIRIGDGSTLFTGTTVGPDTGLDVNVIGGTITGELTVSGLRTAGRTTTMDIPDSAIPIPAAPLTSRNSLSLTNLSPTETIYIGFSTSVTADNVLGTTSGWEVGPNEGFNLDVTDSIIIYAIAETGKTVRVKVLELA